MSNILDLTSKLKAKMHLDNENVKDADVLIDEVVDGIFDVLDKYELLDTTDGFIRDYFNLLENVRSLTYRHMGIDHPFHKIMDKTIDVSHDESGGYVDVNYKTKMPEDEE